MKKKPMISVCIPTYEMAGEGAKFLSAALDSLKAQSFTDFEVVISDQSDTQEVADIGASYTGALTVRRLDYRDGPRQASANTNNAMRHASGNVLKILFQDDMLCQTHWQKRPLRFMTNRMIGVCFAPP
jgi:glycosyltransferase involved in cell wall biosynthesis